jgi:hypothetical protein
MNSFNGSRVGGRMGAIMVRWLEQRLPAQRLA